MPIMIENDATPSRQDIIYLILAIRDVRKST
jgi:hypothetical protein